jgi:hypothetical protein
MPQDIRIAVPYYKPEHNRLNRAPDYYLHEYDEWLVLPYELTGLSSEDIAENKAWVKPILDELEPLR